MVGLSVPVWSLGRSGKVHYRTGDVVGWGYHPFEAMTVSRTYHFDGAIHASGQ